MRPEIRTRQTPRLSFPLTDALRPAVFAGKIGTAWSQRKRRRLPPAVGRRSSPACAAAGRPCPQPAICVLPAARTSRFLQIPLPVCPPPTRTSQRTSSWTRPQDPAPRRRLHSRSSLPRSGSSNQAFVDAPSRGGSLALPAFFGPTHENQFIMTTASPLPAPTAMAAAPGGGLAIFTGKSRGQREELARLSAWGGHEWPQLGPNPMQAPEGSGH